MATVFVSLPLVIRELVPVLTEIGTDQEQAARSLGAIAAASASGGSPCRAIKWALLYGVVLSLARSLGEFGARQDRSPAGSAMQYPDRHIAGRRGAIQQFGRREHHHRLHRGVHPWP